MSKKLVLQVMEEARKRDVHNINVYVRSDNKAAVHVYQKFGFGVTGRDKGDASLLLMEKIMHDEAKIA